MSTTKDWSSPLSNKGTVIYGTTVDTDSLTSDLITASTSSNIITNTTTTTTITTTTATTASAATTMSLSVASTSDDNNEETGDASLGSMCFAERRADWADPRVLDHILSLCMHKLQRASYGRHESLLRQVQLSCMLHRIRMHSFQLQQQQLQQQPIVFEQDMSSLQSLDSISAYDWDQDATLGPNPLTSNLSLDMLLSMGSSTGSLSSSADPASSSSTSDADQQDIFSLGPLPQQQSSLSSIPLVSFSGDYSSTVGPSSPIALSSIPSMPTSSQEQPLANAAPLQQTYYELLMAANPNEPLSQLLSTSAATVGPSSFTAASSSSSIPTLQHSSAYSVLDPSVPSFSTVSSPTVPAVASQNSSSADQVLSPTAPSFTLAAVPVASLSENQPQTVPLTTKEIMDALSGQFPIQPISSPQADTSTGIRTSASRHNSFSVDADDSSFPETSQSLSSYEAAEPAVVAVSALGLSPVVPESNVAAAVLAAIKVVESFDSTVISEPFTVSAASNSSKVERSEAPCTVMTADTTPDPTLITTASITISNDLEEQISKHPADKDVDMPSPPPALVQHITGMNAVSGSVNPENDSSTSSASSVQELEETFESSISVPSIPSSPTKSSARSRTSNKASAARRRSSRAQTRRYKAKTVGSPIASVETSSEDLNDEDDRSSKRQRTNEEDASSSSCSSPESSPPSPKTPPPLAESHSTHDTGHLLPALQGLESEDDQLLSHHGLELNVLKRASHETDDEDHEIQAPLLKKKKSIRSKTTKNLDGKALDQDDGGDAGVLSPSLLPRYSASGILTRRSARIQQHQRQSASSSVDIDVCLSSSGIPNLAVGRSNKSTAA
ncbi:hypothetical protein BGX28_000942 [Mortierella sp. GBA30]|nr:hypothetical protein BGX28_000942 [Mortierella sp. GBA30]